MSTDRFDHLFPRFHVRPRTGFVNDPNGPLLVDGVLHLYFQYRAASSGAGPVSWGHATSTDFVTWTYHRPAISPQPYGPDRDGCWSGTTVIDEDEVVALYAGFATGVAHQPVVLARSGNVGFSFDDGRVVVDGPPADQRIAHFRDPFVWRDAERWKMLVGGGSEDGVASALLYESSDLEGWTQLPALASLPRQEVAGLDTGSMWECPQLADVAGTDVLLVSPWVPGEGLKPVLTITDPAGRCRVDRLDHGSSFYAASVLRQSLHGPLVWGWATEARSDDWCIETDWSGVLTLPRRLALDEDGSPLSRPLPELRRLRGRTLSAGRDGSGTIVVSGIPAQFELELTLAPAARRKPLNLRLRFGPNEWLEWLADPESGEVSVDTTAASSDDRARGGVAGFIEPALRTAAGLGLTLFADGSIVELFTSGGRVSTVRAYPTAAPPWTILLDGLHEADEVACWDLRAVAR